MEVCATIPWTGLNIMGTNPLILSFKTKNLTTNIEHFGISGI